MDQKTDPPKRPRARRLSAPERRAQLMACALRVFARFGLGQGRHAEIAAEAGVAVPTVFVYFPTRDALVDAVLDAVARFIIDEVVAPLQTLPLPVPERLVATALAFADSIDTHPAHARVWLDWSTAIRDDIWPRYLEFQDQVIALLCATIEAGKQDGSLAGDLDSGDAARLLVGSAHMIALMKFSHRDDEQVRHFVRSLVDGYRARDGRPR